MKLDRRQLFGVLAGLFVSGGPAAAVLTLKHGMCKFPVGDPRDSDLRFCAREATNAPYCPAHTQLPYQPTRRRCAA